MSESLVALPLIRRRAEAVFARLVLDIHRQTDRIFAVVMTLQWLFGIAVAIWVSPRAWAGSDSSVHVHIWAAVVLGGLISALPVALAVLRPGRATTRYTIAVGQMLTSALLIHLMGGRIETHFHIFVSLAFLALYRDYRVLIPATITVAADHLIRGIWWPESVYGVLASSQWRLIEHVGWVAFEDVVLAVGCIRGSRELWKIAERTAASELSEERYRAVVEQSAEGVCVFDAQSLAVLEHNPAFLAVVGLTPAEADGLCLTDALMPGSAALRDVVADLLHDGTSRVVERTVQRPDGRRVEVAWSLSLTTYAGRPVVCGALRDVTEQHRLAVESARSRDEALESARMKSEFLANMSHEIRTPMNGVVGMSGLLLDTPLSPLQREFAETIRESADALLTIINDILDFSKVEAGKLTFEILDFDLRQALEGTLDLLAPRATTRGLELGVLVDADVPSSLRGDPGRLRQIVLNLAGNAVKFTERGGVVMHVSLVRESDTDAMVRFEVTDTGIGVPEAAQGRLFKAFSQADGSTTRRFGGTGLGLVIASRLVELMGGEIGMRSTVGEGSTFWFTAIFSKQAQRAETSAVSLPRLHDQRVLVVDDNEINRRILHFQLAGWGIAHEIVSSGADALAALRQAVAEGRAFAAAILDRQMPEMDGLTLARAIQADTAIMSTKLMMLTSFGDHDTDAIVAAGIRVYLSKPAKETQLRESLVRLLSSQDVPARVAETTVAAPVQMLGVRVLVAEDNIVNQKVALHQLRRLGYTADAVANGVEVLTALDSIPYDVILMDCQMPEMDGYEATQHIRLAEQLNGRRVAIIAMTAGAMVGDREACLAAGMDDYITKPVKPAELRDVIGRWSAAASHKTATPLGGTSRADAA